MRAKFIGKKLWAGRRRAEEPRVRSERTVDRIEGSGFEWIDMQNPDREGVEKLAREYGLNALNVEDSLAKFELPKIDVYEDHAYIMLHFPPLASRHSMPKYGQLSIFIGRKFVITMHQGDLSPLLDLVAVCRDGIDPDRQRRILGASTPVVFHEIIDALVDDLLHTLRRVMANLDDIEEGVFDEKKSVAKKIYALRREITSLRRIVGPIKKIVLEASKSISKYSREGDISLYFDDVIDHIDKVIDALEEARETMEIYKDTDFVLSSERTGKVLAVLTIIFTLAMPATVIGTFYGMNVSLPGGLDDGGAYGAFVAAISASAGAAGIMYLYFRRLGWMSG